MAKVRSRIATALLLVSLLLSFLPTVGAADVADWQKIDPALHGLMSQNAGGRWPIIIEAATPTLLDAGKQGQPGRARRAAERLQANGVAGRAPLTLIGSATGVGDFRKIASLSHDPAVGFIYYDAPLRVAEAVPPAHVYEDVIQAPAVWDLGYTGKGVGVAVLDSGVTTAADLTTPVNRVVARVDIVHDGAKTLDPGGHGSHVAGIIAGNGAASLANASGVFRGVAPDANIVDVRVIDSQGRSSLSVVIRGIEWVIQHRKDYNIRVLNLSLGTPVSSGYSFRTDPLVAALEMAWLSGITVVVPAGNEGPNSRTISSPGTGPLFITVGASDDAGTATVGDDSVPSFSGRGPTPDGFDKPDLVAPGRRLISLHSPGSYLDNLLPDRVVTTSSGSTYFRLTGTSMAAPVVSGAAALLLEKNPALRPDQVKAILTSTSGKFKGYDKNTVGSGIVNVHAAIDSKALERANRNKRPADATARGIFDLAKGKSLSWWNSVSSDGAGDNVNWDNVNWDNVNWDNVNWDNVNWDSVNWDNTLWDNALWDVAWPTNSMD